MKIALAVMGAALAGVIGFTVVLAVQVAGLHGQVSAAQGQLARDRRELAAAARVVSTQQARINGNHRDLITCGDLQSMINNGYLATYWVDSANTLQSTPGTLPGHCVNQ